MNAVRGSLIFFTFEILGALSLSDIATDDVSDTTDLFIYTFR
jgi:hypothetical protein